MSRVGTLAVEGCGAPAGAVDPLVPGRIKYEPGLDSVRALALAAVLVFHGIGGPEGGQHIGRGGFLGVDVFFVLSGYLITTLLLRERAAEGRLNLRTFWLRRAARLLPALVLMLAITVAYAHLGAPAAGSIQGAIVPALLYYQNWHMIGRPLSLESHTWSLSIEEQWYLVWPIVLGIALWRTRRPSRLLLVFVIAMTVASVYWTAHIYDPLSGRSYLETETRAQSLLVGAGLAIAFALYGRPRTMRSARVLDVGAIASLVVLVWAFATWREEAAYVYNGGLFLVAVASAVVIVAATHPDSWVRRALSLRVLVVVGLISYGAYLYNPIVDAILDRQRTRLGPLWLFWVQLGVTLGFAYVSWRLLEQPFRRVASRAVWPWIALIGAVAALLVGTFTIDTGVAASTPVQFDTVLRGYAKLADSAPEGSSRFVVMGGTGARVLQVAVPVYRTRDAVGIALGTPGCGVTAPPAPRQPGMSHFQIVRCSYAAPLDRQIAGAFRASVVAVWLEPRDSAPRMVDGATAPAGSAAWARDAVQQLDRLRARLPASARSFLIVEPCGGDDAATATWAKYARAHRPLVRFVRVPTSTCVVRGTHAAASTWAWLTRQALAGAS